MNSFKVFQGYGKLTPHLTPNIRPLCMLLIEILCRRRRVVLQVGLWLGKSQVMFLCIILLPYDHTQWSGTWGFRLRNSILGYLQFHTYLYPNYLNLIPFKNLSYSNALFDTLKI